MPLPPLRRAAAPALLAAALLAVPAPAWADPPAEDADFTLTVLHANDLESALLGAPADADYGGAARFTALMERLRAEESGPEAARGGESEHRGVVSLSSGDMYLAGPELSASMEEGAPFYDAIAAARTGWDAISFGNHEFDFGPDFYADYIEAYREAGGTAPFLSANTDVSAEPRLAELAAGGAIAPSTVLEEQGEEIGVVGALTPQLPAISSPRGVVVDPEVAAAVQGAVDDLTDEGVDKIVLISHLQDIGNERALVSELRDVDVVIAGGGGEVQAGPDTPLVPGDTVTEDPQTGEPMGYPLWAQDSAGTEVPVVQANSDYKYIGRLVADFDAEGNLLRIAERSGPVRVSGTGEDAVEPDPGVHADVHEPVGKHLDELAEDTAATSEVPLDGVRDPGVRTAETNLGNLVADAVLAAGRAKAGEYGVPEPQLALQNGGGIRNNSVLPAGPVSELDTYSVLPFANQVAVVPELPRSQVKELLENAVSRIPAADGRFAQVAGVEFGYDAGRTAQQVNDDGEVLTAGERVRDAVLADGTVLVADGQVVEGDPVTVATIDFSAAGGDQYPFRGADFTPVGTVHQQALSAYLRGDLGGTVTAADYPEGGEGRITRLD
ncbi:bifunctional metallophosphatase/5'-nucleotidase [Nocardiopsis composta]|uniref:5'-nucleotidase n=1 Tax=Nocardiopsis composta TaxID=157465 RepID=A0A7W8QRU3_9ACTN|nr:5'-nucleotidase C-terminal domain-containing protein [Nocardiopsis composta]MBB5434703.1 5'-nucleotidase [Nocardiopsis composta]